MIFTFISKLYDLDNKNEMKTIMKLHESYLIHSCINNNDVDDDDDNHQKKKSDQFTNNNSCFMYVTEMKNE